MNLNAFYIMFFSKFLPLVYAIIGFGLLIIVHEFGHFLFCKLFKIHTPTFSIGMGPTIVQKKIGSTNFRIAAIPLGGYVEIAGLAEVGQGEQRTAALKGEGSFSSKPYWKKLLVLLGGVLFNLLFAYITYSMLFFSGIPKKQASVRIIPNIEKEVKEKFKLEGGDKIIAINDKKLEVEPKKLFPIIQKLLVKPLTEGTEKEIKLQIFRKEKTINLSINAKNVQLNEKLLGSLELKTSPIKGEYEKYPFFTAIYQGIKVTNQWVYQIIYSIGYLIKQKTLRGAGGPIMIISKTFQTAQEGIIPLLIFLAFISINLAIMNLLPIGALDGGQILFATIEAIIRREIPEIIKLVINLASWVLILGLILYLSYRDILSLFRG